MNISNIYVLDVKHQFERFCIWIFPNFNSCHKQDFSMNLYLTYSVYMNINSVECKFSSLNPYETTFIEKRENIPNELRHFNFYNILHYILYHYIKKYNNTLFKRNDYIQIGFHLNQIFPQTIEIVILCGRILNINFYCGQQM